MKILHTSRYQYMVDALIEHFNMTVVESANPLSRMDVYIKTFPDGEIYHRVEDDFNNQDVMIIGGTIDDSETLELYDLACHVAKHGAKTLTLVIPYYGYSTMEREVKYGEVVKAKTRAMLLSSIPKTFKNTVVFIDLHSEGIPHYLEGNILPVHLYAKDLIKQMCFDMARTPFVLGSTDAGRAKWVESLAADMGVECAIITKRRISGNKTDVSGINADVKGRLVIIYDDMIRTGGSLIGAAQAYLDAGADSVGAVATHGVLPDLSLIKLKDSGVLSSVYVTNTHPNAIRVSDTPYIKDFYKVYDASYIIRSFIEKDVYDKIYKIR